MIDLYFWPTPNGYKASIMLSELALEHRVIPVDITAGEQFHPEFLKINPNNKVPAIVDHDPAGQELDFEWSDTVDGRLVPDFTPRPNPVRTRDVEISANLFTIGVHELTLTVTARDGRKASTTLRMLVGPCGSCGG